MDVLGRPRPEARSPEDNPRRRLRLVSALLSNNSCISPSNGCWRLLGATVGSMTTLTLPTLTVGPSIGDADESLASSTTVRQGEYE